MEQQEITVCAAIIISGPLVYHLIRWNVEKLDPLGGVWKRFHADDPLLTFLNSL